MSRVVYATYAKEHNAKTLYTVKYTPMELNIKESAKLYKMARSTIYNKLEKGELSRLPNGMLDYTELLRVFGEPAHRKARHDAKAQIQTLQQPKETAQEAMLREQVRMLQEALRIANEEKNWLRDKVDTLTDTVKLLQAPPAPQKRRLLFRLFGD